MGPSEPSDEVARGALEIGRMIAERGGVVVTGGCGGVMEAASRGASEAGGTAIGILPTFDRSAANPWLTASIPTGLGELRNGLVVRAGDVVISCGGSWGTLSEVALALRSGRPVVAFRGWDLEGLSHGFESPVKLPKNASTPEEAVQLAFDSIESD